LEGSDATAARQVAREDLLAAKTKVPNERSTQRRKSATPVTTPSNPTLIAQPGSETGTTPPTGEVTQGPSPMDYSLEIEADFPTDMVLEM
jgi:hypothetical protein